MAAGMGNMWILEEKHGLKPAKQEALCEESSNQQTHNTENRAFSFH